MIGDIPLVSSIERHAFKDTILKTEMVNTYIFEGTIAPWLWQCKYHLSYQSSPESRSTRRFQWNLSVLKVDCYKPRDLRSSPSPSNGCPALGKVPGACEMC